VQLKLIIFLLCLFVAAGCRRSEPGQKATNRETLSAEQLPPTPPTGPTNQPVQKQTAASDSTEAKPETDACALLTSDDIKSIQGEAVKETKLSGRSAGGFSVSQCFFTLPTFTNSVSLAVTQRGEGAGARDPREFWKDKFHGEEELEKGRNGGESPGGEEEEEKSAPPQKIAGIGDEAFWMGSRVVGALYVLKGHSYVRVSIGGSGDQQSKIQRSKALAQKVIKRL
jgi:hypothetical protein